MIVKRPSIFIYTHQADPLFLKEIEAGIEEEGVLYECFERPEENAAVLALQATEDSMLGSGIGISGVDAARQIKGLSCGKEPEWYHMPTVSECRRLGANSARTIKKLPFK